jgi:hypothetical protein
LSELSIVEFFHDFLKKTGILEYIETKSFDDLEDLYTFFNKIKEWGTHIPNFTLEKLFTKIELYKTYNYPIPRQILGKQKS